MIEMKRILVILLLSIPLVSFAQTKPTEGKPEFYQLRSPETENGFGYSFAVKVGTIIKASGAVSMDAQGKPTAVGDFAQQMKNCYADIEKMLKHYGCTFDDVIVENIYTTNMPLFLKNLEYRKSLYKDNNYPKSTWLGVKELAMPELMIEIEVEVYKAD